MRSLRPAVLIAATFVITTFAGAASADAALPWAACKPTGFQCATLDVPIDRSGGLAGTIKLSATRKPAAAGPASTAIVALAGGPGQAALPIAEDFSKDLGAFLGANDLLVYDQRGTGKSGALHCSALNATSGSLTTVVRKCAAQIGPRRAFYTTAQSAEDIEALRVAGGYSKLILYGVSYGTKVALAYAAAHPTTTQALVLDSVVGLDGPDALQRSTLNAVPRVVGNELCGGGACRSITPSAVADLKKFAGKLNGKVLRGPVYSPSGRRYTASLTNNGLVSILVAGDQDPTLRAEFPGSVKAALNGDYNPILRLSVRASGSLDNGVSHTAYQESEETDDNALYFATLCEENTTLPWTRGAPEEQRAREGVAAIKAAPPGTFGIFPREVGLGGIPSSCLGWPVASPPPAAPAPLPDVPTLIIDGRLDLRTPIEDATKVAAQFPHVQFVPVPLAGHSVLGVEEGTCGKDAVNTFAAGGVAAQCAPAKTVYSPTPRPPASLASVRGVSGLSPKIGRTVRAVAQTLDDSRRQVIGAALGTGSVPRAVGGLRGGSVKVLSLASLVLRAYEYAPGVKVTGSYSVRSGAARLTVSGRSAAHGSLTFSARGTITGTLDGKRIRVGAGRSARGLGAAASDGFPTLAEAARQGRLVAALG